MWTSRRRSGPGTFGTGIIVAVRVNGDHKLFMWYEKKDGTLTYRAPHCWSTTERWSEGIACTAISGCHHGRLPTVSVGNLLDLREHRQKPSTGESLKMPSGFKGIVN
jgi:hypothetical protein